MQKILALLYVQRKIMLQNWKVICLLIFTPMLVLSGIGLICFQLLKTESAVHPFSVAIVDQDGTEETKFFIQHLLDSDHITELANFQMLEINAAKDLLKKDEIASIIVIPENFSENVRYGINEPLTVIGNPNRPVQSMLIFSLLESATKFISAAQSAINTIYHFLTEENISREIVRDHYSRSLLHFGLFTLSRGDFFEETKLENFHKDHFLQFYSYSFYILTIMIWAYGLVILLKQKTSSSLSVRLESRGMTSIAISSARFIVLFLSLFFLGIALFLPLYFYFDLSANNFLAIIAIIFTSAAFITFIDSIISSDKGFTIFGFLLIMIGAFAGGQIIPTLYLPEWLGKIGEFTLNYQFMELLIPKGESSSFLSVLAIGLVMLFICLGFQSIKDRRRVLG